jgi:hypothetical protein
MNYRYYKTCEFVAIGMKAGKMIFSSIAHCHVMAIQQKLPTDFAFWQNYCLHLINRSNEVVVLGLEGWEQSKGVTAERDFCRAQGIPVTIFEPIDFGSGYPARCEEFWSNHNYALDR